MITQTLSQFVFSYEALQTDSCQLIHAQLYRTVQSPDTLLLFVQNLKTAEELENEDREAQSAKLQELIRRGTPRDLAQAQELMKALAGANPDAKPDYKSQALTELNKLENKVILLNEMLDNVDLQRGERFATGDVYDVSSKRVCVQGTYTECMPFVASSIDTEERKTEDSGLDIECGIR